MEMNDFYRLINNVFIMSYLINKTYDINKKIQKERGLIFVERPNFLLRSPC